MLPRSGARQGWARDGPDSRRRDEALAAHERLEDLMLKAVMVHDRLAEGDVDGSRKFAIEDCHSSAMDGKRGEVRLS